MGRRPVFLLRCVDITRFFLYLDKNIQVASKDDLLHFVHSAYLINNFHFFMKTKY